MMIDFIRDSYGTIVPALAGASLGRVTWYSIRVQEGKRRFLDIFLITDMIIVAAMALLGGALGVWYMLPGVVVAALSAILGYLGPRGIDQALARFVEKRGDK